MSNYVVDNTTSYGPLSGSVFPKADNRATSVAAISKIAGTDWNRVGQACSDIRQWLTGTGTFYGIAVGANPSPSGLGAAAQPAYFYASVIDNQPHFVYNGVDSALALGGASLTGTGSANRLTYWGTSTGLTYDAQVSIDATNHRIGFGIASPLQTLHLTGGGRLRVSNGTNSLINDIYAPVDGVLQIESQGTVQILYNDDNASTDSFGVYRVNTSGTPVILCNNTNQVGINNGSPASGFDLDISKALRITPTSNNAVIELGSGSSVSPGASGTVRFRNNAGVFEVANGTSSFAAVALSGSGLTGTGTSNTLTKWTGASTLGNSLITDNGNAITIASSAAALTLTSNASATWSVVGTLTLTGSSGVSTSSVWTHTGVSNFNATGGSQIMIAPASGNINLGSQIPANTAFCQYTFNDQTATYRGYIGYIGASAGFGARNDTFELGSNAKDITIRPNETERMRFSSGGNINIQASGGSIGFFGVTAAARQTSGANLTNNVTSGGTTDTVDTWTDLTTYATDAAAIRNAVYQLARKLKQVNDGLRAYGLLT